MGLFRVPKRLKRGERLPAEWCNQVADALATLSGLRAAHPLRLNAGDGGLMISLGGRGPTRRFEARITARNGGSGPAIPATFTYSVIVPDVPELGTLTGLTPKYRPGPPDLEITPAGLGDHCEIVERLDGAGVRKWELELHAGSEKVYFDACATPRPAPEGIGEQASGSRGEEATRIVELERLVQALSASQIELFERLDALREGGGE